MARLFGTDGIRGVANVDLKPTLAYALGRATAHRLVGPGGRSWSWARTPAARVTCSSPRSPPGASSLGADVHIVGVVPTPALAFLAGAGPFAAGIMVSASHNPADDNGLKVLDRQRAQARRRRRGRARSSSSGRPTSSAASPTRPRAGRRARATSSTATATTASPWPAASMPPGCGIVLDGANGSGCVARAGDPGARPAPTVEVIHVEPDGVNINVRCGATAPGIARARRCSRTGADVGFALDGDADRLIAVDARRPRRRRRPGPGHPRARPPARGRAAGRGSSSRSSRTAGCRPSSRRPAGQVVRTPVGDKYILEGMQVSGARPGRREERPRDRPRPHDLGRRDRHRARGAAGR